MKSKKIRRMLGLTLLTLSAGAVAHHSNAPHFDTNVEVSVEGTVTSWAFVNPHAYVYFDVIADNGETENWRCEMSSATSMGRRGFDENTFYPGLELTINGNPARREDNVCFMTSLAFEDGVVIGGRDFLPEDKRSGALAAVIATDAERPEYLENGQPNISGYWVAASRGGPIPGATGAGGPPGGMGGMGGGYGGPQIELTEAGAEVQANFEINYDIPAMHCDIGNIFFGLVHDGHVNEIVQEEDKVTLQYGYMDFLRTIHLNMDEHPENIEPSRGGHSIGWWEGDVLVVDTVGFAPGVLSQLTGHPYSEQMHSVERYWFDEESQELNMEFVAEDPLYLVGTHTGDETLQMSAQPYETYNCVELSGDNNRRPEDRSGTAPTI